MDEKLSDALTTLKKTCITLEGIKKESLDYSEAVEVTITAKQAELKTARDVVEKLEVELQQILNDKNNQIVTYRNTTRACSEAISKIKNEIVVLISEDKTI